MRYLSIILFSILVITSCVQKNKSPLQFTDNTQNAISPTETTSTTTTTTEGDPSLSINTNVATILTNRCASCHDNGISYGGLGSLSETDLINSGHIIAGNPEASRIYIRMADGTMPPGGGVPLQEIADIYTWISNIPVTDQTPTIPALAPTYSSLHANIFFPKCVGCHNDTDPGRPGGGYSMSTHLKVLDKVNIEDPTGSALYNEVFTGQMPPGSSPNLTAEEIEMVLQWINNGALND